MTRSTLSGFLANEVLLFPCGFSTCLNLQNPWPVHRHTEKQIKNQFKVVIVGNVEKVESPRNRSYIILFGHLGRAGHEDMNLLSIEDRNKIDEGLRKKYAQVALTPEGSFRYPTGIDGLKEQNYGSEILKNLPPEVLASYCGVGNPFRLGTISDGESVLDIGCGAGVDTLIAAMMVGKKGRVIGIDIIPEMLRRARENLNKTSLGNVTFQEASGEDIPLPDNSIDVVISNGVFNLIPDKPKALKEVFRVLKPSGRFMIADQILTTAPSDDTESRVKNWAG